MSIFQINYDLVVVFFNLKNKILPSKTGIKILISQRKKVAMITDEISTENKLKKCKAEYSLIPKSVKKLIVGIIVLYKKTNAVIAHKSNKLIFTPKISRTITNCKEKVIYRKIDHIKTCLITLESKFIIEFKYF